MLLFSVACEATRRWTCLQEGWVHSETHDHGGAEWCSGSDVQWDVMVRNVDVANEDEA